MQAPACSSYLDKDIKVPSGICHPNSGNQITLNIMTLDGATLGILQLTSFLTESTFRIMVHFECHHLFTEEEKSIMSKYIDHRADIINEIFSRLYKCVRDTTVSEECLLGQLSLVHEKLKRYAIDQKKMEYDFNHLCINRCLHSTDLKEFTAIMPKPF